MEMKYITVRVYISRDLTRIVPFIFPKTVSHDIMAKAAEIVCADHDWIYEGVRSAGFVRFGEIPECTGYSETLRTGPADGDATILSMHEYGVDIGMV
jgi:hypothetical protein